MHLCYDKQALAWKFKVDSCFQRTNPVLREVAGKESRKPQREPGISSLVPLLALVKVVYKRIFLGRNAES